MPAELLASVEPQPLVQHPVGILAVLLAVLAAIFKLTEWPVTARVFKVIPALVFCYFVPTLLATCHVIPEKSLLYTWVQTFLLPASLLLLVLSLDVPGIIRLGPKAIIMLLAGTIGVVIGGPLSLLLVGRWLPEEAWRGMAALAGSWIGGAANQLALKEAAGAPDAVFGPIIVVDVVAAYVWMGILFYLAGHRQTIDRWMGADVSVVHDLEKRMAAFQQRSSRVPAVADLMMIFALAFVGRWLSHKAGAALSGQIAARDAVAGLNDVISAKTWTFILATAIGLGLSFTPARQLDGAGASKIGTVIIYLLVACIGASANFREVTKYPAFLAMAFIWLAVHVVVLVLVARLIRAPLFLAAVGSQANIGGPVSAPAVASAFHPSLVPVGALLAVAGYVLGTYAGLVCMSLLKMVARAG